MKNQPLKQFVLLASAFALGLLVERSGRWLAPYYYTPTGMERTFAPFWEAWHAVDKYFVDRKNVDHRKMTEGAIQGMIASLGDVNHTTYLPPDGFKDLQASLKGNFEGIGALVGENADRQPIIASIMPGWPAQKAGLKAGDVLLSIDGRATSGLRPDQVAPMVRGPAGTHVQLQILRGGKQMEFDIVRAKVDLPDVDWHMLPGLPIMHVAIHKFGEHAREQVEKAIAEARDKGARGAIVDLRNDGGGLREQAVSVTSQFLSGGNVFIEKDAKGKETPVPVEPGGKATSMPICMLINGGTASAAEIFAGAVQDHHRGKLIGTRTIGTGTVLQTFTLSDGSAILLAIYEWLTPDGRQIWHEGIKPDVEVTMPPGAQILLPESEADMTAAQLENTKDKQLLKAIEILKGDLKYQ
jgi:carboxyl-terminal processing protease